MHVMAAVLSFASPCECTVFEASHPSVRGVSVVKSVSQSCQSAVYSVWFRSIRFCKHSHLARRIVCRNRLRREWWLPWGIGCIVGWCF